MRFVLITAGLFVVWYIIAGPVWDTTPAIRSRELIDGPHEMLQILDAGKFVVRPATETSAISAEDFSFQLSGIELLEHDRQAAIEFVMGFVAQGQPELRFDRQRYASIDQAVGYLYVGERMLNIELVSAGFARPAPVPGNSQTIQKQIRDKYRDRLARQSRPITR